MWARELHKTACCLAPKVLECSFVHTWVEMMCHARVVVGRRQSCRHAPATLDVLENDEWSQGGVLTVNEVQRNGNSCVFRDVLCRGSLLQGLFIRKLDQAGTRKSDQSICPGVGSCKTYSVQNVEAASNQRRHEGCPRSKPLFGEAFYPATRCLRRICFSDFSESSSFLSHTRLSSSSCPSYIAS